MNTIQEGGAVPVGSAELLEALVAGATTPRGGRTGRALLRIGHGQGSEGGVRRPDSPQDRRILSPAEEAEATFCGELAEEFQRSGRTRAVFCAERRALRFPDGTVRPLSRSTLRRLLAKAKLPPRLRADGRHVNPGRPLDVCDAASAFLLVAKRRNPAWKPARLRREFKDYLALPGCRYAGLPVPSTKQIGRLFKRVGAELLTFLFEGQKAWWGKYGFAPYGPLLLPNEVWCSDSAHLGRLRFIDRRTGERLSPWFTFVLDVGSLQPVHFRFHRGQLDEELSLAVLRAAMLPKAGNDLWIAWGRPGAYLSDNGGGYIARGVQRACDEMGIRKDFSPPGMPSGNGQAEAWVKQAKGALVAEVEGLILQRFFEGRVQPSLRWEEFLQKTEEFLEDYMLKTREVHGRRTTSLEDYRARLPEGDPLGGLTAEDVREATMRQVGGQLCEVGVGRRGIRYRGRDYAGAETVACVGRKVILRVDPGVECPPTVQVYLGNEFLEEAALHVPGQSREFAHGLRRHRGRHLHGVAQVKASVDGLADSLALPPPAVGSERRRAKSPALVAPRRAAPVKPAPEPPPFDPYDGVPDLSTGPDNE